MKRRVPKPTPYAVWLDALRLANSCECEHTCEHQRLEERAWAAWCVYADDRKLCVSCYQPSPGHARCEECRQL